MNSHALNSSEAVALGKRFVEAVAQSGLPLTGPRSLPGSGEDFEMVRCGAERLSFRPAYLLWRAHGINPAWLYDGSAPKTLSARGFGWLEWTADMSRPFVEVFAEYLAPLFALKAQGGPCPFALCESLDRAKAALAAGRMTPEQAERLRAFALEF